MSGRIGCCTFTTDENQQINAVARIQSENRNVLIGTVLDECGAPVVDAVVVLFRVNNGCGVPEAITHAFTDRYGQFVFGPLCPDNTYMLKISKDDVELEDINLNCNCNIGGCLGSNDDSDDDDCNNRRNHCRRRR